MFDRLCSMDTHTTQPLKLSVFSRFPLLSPPFFILERFVLLNLYCFVLCVFEWPSFLDALLIFFVSSKRTTDRKYINFLPYPLPLLNFSITSLRTLCSLFLWLILRLRMRCWGLWLVGMDCMYMDSTWI
ncbi:hypothetical protein I7I53_06594 [Histoplasma capsulatum var. duboisii H88]|uniref:Uncharacterized protein n=1 Tax=Ajellomyces capsulatus (strain H88) TaxID=544711 RepID=A0A8A1LFT2_AJEC8|nr:hypothetical protein I7I53_06594 [Histoplasma capsulatum var. duboisii H88]